MSQIKSLLYSKNILYFLFIFSIFLKSILLLTLGAKTFSDGKGYIIIAQDIFNKGFIFPDTQIGDMPITPYIYSFFAPLESFMGISAYIIPNIILASFFILIIHKITLLIYNDYRVANIASIIVAIYPFFNFYTITVLTETIFIFFLYLSMYYSVKFMKKLKLIDLILFSVFFAIASLTRASTVPMYLFFLILFAVFLININRKILIKKYIFISLLAYSFVMSPWVIRNYMLSNEITLTTISLDGGIAFYAGNNPKNKSGGGISGVDYDTKFEKMRDKSLASKLSKQESINWIIDNPMDWIKLEINKFIRFYRLTIYADGYQGLHYKLLSIFSYGLILIFFLIGMYQSKKIFWLYSPMLLFAFLLTGVHMILFASVRYRLPIEPFMIIIASSVIFNLLNNKIFQDK